MAGSIILTSTPQSCPKIKSYVDPKSCSRFCMIRDSLKYSRNKEKYSKTGNTQADIPEQSFLCENCNRRNGNRDLEQGNGSCKNGMMFQMCVRGRFRFSCLCLNLSLL